MYKLIEYMIVDNTEYTLFSSLKSFEDFEQIEVFGLRGNIKDAHKTNIDSFYECADISTSLCFCYDIYNAITKFKAHPIHMQDIILDFLNT